MQKRDSQDRAIAERQRLRMALADQKRAVAELEGVLAGERAKRAEAESRAANYWRMFGQAQDQLHTLRSAVIDRGDSPDALMRERKSRHVFAAGPHSGG